MLNKIKNLWNDYGFEVVVFLCTFFLISCGLIRKLFGYKGSWSNKYYSPYTYKPPSKKSVTNNTIPESAKKVKDSRGETECRKVLESIFKRSFKKARPDFLRNPVTGGSYNLELDCFCPELRLAVEYHGRQHYEYIPFFHKNREAFLNQKYRDELTRRGCQDNNITLIEVSYEVPTNDIKNFLIQNLIQKGFLHSK